MADLGLAVPAVAELGVFSEVGKLRRVMVHRPDRQGPRWRPLHDLPPAPRPGLTRQTQPGPSPAAVVD
jgi:hypothetical protein